MNFILFIAAIMVWFHCAAAVDYPIPFAENAKDEFVVSYLEGKNSK